jgi:hypothetical protein
MSKRVNEPVVIDGPVKKIKVDEYESDEFDSDSETDTDDEYDLTLAQLRAKKRFDMCLNLYEENQEHAKDFPDDIRIQLTDHFKRIIFKNHDKKNLVVLKRFNDKTKKLSKNYWENHEKWERQRIFTESNNRIMLK